MGAVREARSVLLVDAANVVGSRPTGWWRDRPGAARSFVERVQRALAEGTLDDDDVVVVLEGQARQGVEAGRHGGVDVVHAPGHGDDTLVAIAAERDSPVVLVSADRRLGDRVRRLGARVVGPTWLLDRLPD
jgi:hypothetical protein